jgi:hypothetical protein
VISQKNLIFINIAVRTSNLQSCIISPLILREHTVTQLVDALRYKPEGHGFNPRWCHGNFSLTYSFRPHYGPGVDTASKSNKYQEYFLGSKGGRCLGLTNLLPSCADCLEIWEPQPPGRLRACTGIALSSHLLS